MKYLTPQIHRAKREYMTFAYVSTYKIKTYGKYCIFKKSGNNVKSSFASKKLLFKQFGTVLNGCFQCSNAFPGIFMISNFLRGSAVRMFGHKTGKNEKRVQNKMSPPGPLGEPETRTSFEIQEGFLYLFLSG